MKLLVLIVLAAMPNADGSYRYAAKDTSGKTYHVMMLTQYKVGDTIRYEAR